MGKISATEASRNFSELLSRVSAGESIEIVRNGAPVANVVPATRRLWSAQAFRDVMSAAPTVDEEFAGEIDAARGSIGPPVSSWPF
jgi:prevent-host-death family protein